MAGVKSSDRAPTHNKPSKEAPPSVEDTLPAPVPPNTTDPKFTPTHHHPFPTSTHTTNSIPYSQAFPLPLTLPPPLPLPFHPLHQERSYLLTSLQHADSTATHLVRRLAQTQSKLDRLLSPSQGPSPPSRRGAKSISHLRRQHATLKRRLKEAENEEKVILAELGRVVGKIQRVERWVGVRAGPATSGRRWDGDVCWVDERMAALTLGPVFEVRHFHGATRTRLPIQMSSHQPTVSGGASGGGGDVLAPPAVYWTPPSPSYNTAAHPSNTDANAHHIYAHEPFHQSPYLPTPHPLPAIQEEEVGATTPVFEMDGSAHQQKTSPHGCVPTTTDTNTNADGRSIVEVLLERADREGREDGSKLKKGRASASARTKSLPVLAYGGYMEGEGTYMGYGFVDGHVDVDFGEGEEMVGRKKGGGRARSSI